VIFRSTFHMAITWWDKQVFDAMAQVVDGGINTFKHFMAYKGALMVNDEEMFSSFSRCSALGAMPLVHAENGDVVAQLQASLMADGNNGPEAHAYSRPPQVEGEAVNRSIMIADMAGVPLYVVHVSCEEAHEAIRRARQNGKRVFGEPLVQHLTLDESEYAHSDWDHAARRVMSPPFRSKVHQDSLWAGLAAGSLQVVATDHCAFSTDQKRMGVGDFTKIPNGASAQQSAIDYNVFEGFELKGLPRFTLTRGQVAVSDGKVSSEEGHGRFVPREAYPAVNRALSQWKELTAPHPVKRDPSKMPAGV